MSYVLNNIKAQLRKLNHQPTLQYKADLLRYIKTQINLWLNAYGYNEDGTKK